MPLWKPLRVAVAGLAALSIAACAPGAPPSGQPDTVSARGSSDNRTGAQNHPKILQEFGGEVSDRALRQYVDGIGRRLVAQSEQPNAKWTFTVLDSPVVNAFALPGGYVYVTRGLVALANSEAELAGVIGHEMGHVTADHSGDRRSTAGAVQFGLLGLQILGAVAGLSGQSLNALGQVGATAGQGYLASYSRTQEYEADQLGVRYLARAGYDPEAQADFLASLQAETELQAKIAGGSYNPNRVDFFSTHPATAERVREAIRSAGLEQPQGRTPRNRPRFLRQIEGMTYGDSADQGVVDGRTFTHPQLRFQFTVPSGFRIQNAATEVTAAGPNGSGVIFSGDRHGGGSMDAYIARTWAPTIAQGTRVGRLDNLRRLTINGLPAASATLPAEINGDVYLLRMTAIQKDQTVYRFLGLQPQGRDGLGDSMDRAAASFRNITAAQARAVKPSRIVIHEVRRGETVAELARQTPFSDFKEERFRVLNGLGPREAVQPGDLVKLVLR